MAEILTQYHVTGVTTSGDKALTYSIEPPVPMAKHGILNGTVDTMLIRTYSQSEQQEGVINSSLQKMRENHAVSTRNTENESQLTVDFAPMGLGTDYVFGIADMRRMLSGVVQSALENLGE